MNFSNFILIYISLGAVVYLIVTIISRRQNPVGQELLNFEQSYRYVIIKITSGILVFISCLIIWPYTIFLYLRKFWKNREGQSTSRLEQSNSLAIDMSSLIKKVEVEAVEAEELVDDPLEHAPLKPFGFRFGEWSKFKQHLHPSGELWTFSQETVPDHKFCTVQISGYCVKHSGSVSSVFVTDEKITGMVGARSTSEDTNSAKL